MTTASTLKTKPTSASSDEGGLRVGLGAAVLVAVLAAIALMAYLVLAVQWYGQPFLGLQLSHTQIVSEALPTTGAGWNGLNNALFYRDHLTSLSFCRRANDCETFDWSSDAQNYRAIQLGVTEFLADRLIGDDVTIEFSRPVNSGATNTGTLCGVGSSPDVRPCRGRVTLARFPSADFIAYFIVPFGTAAAILLIGVAILGMRYQQPAAQMTAVVASLMAVFLSGVFDYRMMHQLAPLWLFATCMLGGALAALGMLFPSPMSMVYRRPALVAVPFGMALIFAVAALVLYYTPTTPWDFQYPLIVALCALGTGLFALIFSLFEHRRTAITTTIRDQSNTALLGWGLLLVPVIMWIISLITQSFDGGAIPFVAETSAPFLLAPLLSIGYAFIQYKRIDTDKIISQGIAYGLMLAALVAGYFLLVLGASLLTTESISATNPIMVAITIFVIAVMFLPARSYLQQRIDEIYFRLRRNYQGYIETFAQKLTTLVELNKIIKEFRTTVEDAISPGSIFVFLVDYTTKEFIPVGDPRPETDVRFPPDTAFVRLLKNSTDPIYLEASGRPWPEELRTERTRLLLLKTAIITGLQGTEQLNGFVCISAPRAGASRREYTFEELKFVANLVGQMAVAIERTQVVNSLSRRVRELDVLSQVSQAVNFTIEFDALLELISNQTDKLIPAKYFYIVLRDQIAEQLYYAFFVEDEERYREKEGKRWPIGRGLYSEVITTSKPLRVENYYAALAQRNTTEQAMSADVKAWMGVPLIAGPRTLGVIAIGTTDANKPYNDEQLKIFSDIAALAATSLDKARLFAETDQRARQLAVLNEISRRLVATEADVEKLLQIITSSAVEILNAEAGSLFLLAEDGSGDLEFRVVVGGSGQELVGSRIPAGKGLVGEVAKRGKPQIVNEAAQDKRVADVSKGKFHTSSLLAVPLIAKNRSIGVLEVLNRKDGGIYTEDDTALLSTFAGQAAIAIENARLFQMTDLQLNKRIQELEALERIDVELNRTLDLKKVAEIAVRWAVAQTGATAGLIGLVTADEPPMLNVLAMYGYGDDAPDGADGKLWPLAKGIVHRVMRTRQPDLATDTSIDPDYTPSLRGTQSQITIPMISGTEITALLVLESERRDQRLGLLDLQFAQRLAEHASIAIENARLTETIRRTVDSKSEFMGFAAHELKNPLASVKGYADLMMGPMGGMMSDQQKKDFLTVIRNNAGRMETIINDLRDAAATEAGKLKMELAPINFWNVVIETLRPFQKQLEDKTQELVNNVPEDLPDVMGDQTRLIQVMTNLVSNAHKYSPPGATITISGQIVDNINKILEERHKTRRSKTRYTGRQLYITISDTGIGMSAEDLAKLFREQYFRSDNPLAREQPGTGLGMMITQNIIQMHYGEIWVTSELNVGTTFHFFLPLATQEQRTAEPASD